MLRVFSHGVSASPSPFGGAGSSLLHRWSVRRTVFRILQLRHGHSPHSLVFSGAALPPPSAAPQSVLEVQSGGYMRMVLVLRRCAMCASLLQRCRRQSASSWIILRRFFASIHAISGASFASSGPEGVFRPSILLRVSRRFLQCSVSPSGHAPIGLLLWKSSSGDVDERVF